LIAQHARVAGLPFPDDGGLVLARPSQMAIDAVVARVELAAEEPFGKRGVPFEDLVPLLEPGERLRLLRPEPLGIVGRAFPERVVVGLFDVGLRDEGRGWGEAARFLEDAGDIGGRRGHYGFLLLGSFQRVSPRRGATRQPRAERSRNAAQRRPGTDSAKEPR